MGRCHSIFGQFGETRDGAMRNMGTGFVVLSHHSLFHCMFLLYMVYNNYPKPWPSLA